MVAFVGHRTGGINTGEGFPGSSLNEGKRDLRPLLASRGLIAGARFAQRNSPTKQSGPARGGVINHHRRLHYDIVTAGSSPADPCHS